jgi:hypothetical protein
MTRELEEACERYRAYLAGIVKTVDPETGSVMVSHPPRYQEIASDRALLARSACDGEGDGLGCDITDQQVAEWGERYDINIGSFMQLRCAFDDARTLPAEVSK